MIFISKKGENNNTVTSENSLLTLKPNLSKMWHTSKNSSLSPDKIRSNSNKKVWWICDKGHEWEAKPSGNSDKSKCPYCINKRILKGFNDMWTTNPEQASLLLNSEDGYKYMEQCNTKLWWKCGYCDYETFKTPNKVYVYGLCCPNCSATVTLSEKIMSGLLSNKGIDFRYNKSFEWSNRKRYDFYIPSLNMIIEMHGIQHYIYSGRGRQIKEEQINDQYKYDLAINNGIVEYITIDCRKSEFEYIKESILNSNLNKIINEVDFAGIQIDKDYNLYMKRIIDLWNNGIKYTNEITRILDIDPATVKKYLHIGSISGLCDYDKSKKYIKYKKVYKFSLELAYLDEFNSPLDAARSVGKNSSSSIIECCKGKLRYVHNHVWMYEDEFKEYISNPMEYKMKNFKIIQLDKNMNFVSGFIIPNHASTKYGIGRTLIVDCCENNAISAGGFHWMYIDNYKKFLKGEFSIKEKGDNKIKVVQMTSTDDFIKVWDSMKEASLKLNLASSSHIGSCCKGKQKTCRGFKWMYLEEYENKVGKLNVD